MRVLFVINPKSGNRPEETLEKTISDQSKKQSFEYRIYKMQGKDDTSFIKKEIKSYNPQIIAGAGGDGTVNLLSKLLLNTGKTLLIVPLGSANGMARELGISNRIDQCLELLSKGFTREIDLLKINGHICIHLADVGLNARIVKRFEQDNRRGLLTYAKHMFYELFLIKQYKFYIKYDNNEVSRKAVSLTFANASKYGTGAVINPTGRINDGKFELVIVKPFPRVKLLSIAWKMFNGTLQTSEYVEVLGCKQALIRSSRKTTLQIDGEIIGKTREIRLEILEKALKVLVPSEKIS
ncbi:diacylglycerol/lipid kinase family protein [Rubrolithibacter danxiaensis]|uniref:diacylglycerol/lipid kinase family protein n=1 Tax=Rubrolithibacter danxiaensis TaxID=3390805 RepID=UPI003BF8C79A